MGLEAVRGDSRVCALRDAQCYSRAMGERRARPRRAAGGVRGSRTGRPVMVVLDLLGRRWTLRVLWELRNGALTFRALRERCEAMSPSVLNQRLAELRDHGIVELEAAGYALTADGRSLLAALAPLQDWSTRWARHGAGSGPTVAGRRRG